MEETCSPYNFDYMKVKTFKATHLKTTQNAQRTLLSQGGDLTWQIFSNDLEMSYLKGLKTLIPVISIQHCLDKTLV